MLEIPSHKQQNRNQASGVTNLKSRPIPSFSAMRFFDDPFSIGKQSATQEVDKSMVVKLSKKEPWMKR